MAIIFRFSLILSALVICSLCIDNVGAEEKTVVHFIGYLPKGSAPVNIECKANYVPVVQHSLAVGEDYQWSPTANATHDCQAIWGRYFASWQGFEPTRDNHRALVFWLINKKGFYLGYDKSTWKLVEEWETE